MASSAPTRRLAPAVLDPLRWRALALLCGAFFMVLLDGTRDEAGLASGLSNTALQIGTALGVAIVSTVAVSRSADYLAADPLAVLTEGYQSAFVACAVPPGPPWVGDAPPPWCRRRAGDGNVVWPT